MYLGLAPGLAVSVDTVNYIVFSLPNPECLPAFTLLALEVAEAEENQDRHHQRNDAHDVEAVRDSLGGRDALDLPKLGRQRQKQD